MTKAPVIIVACALIGKSGYTDGELLSDKKDAWYMYDVALAMQNLTLAAAELGLGTVHVGSFDASKAAQVLMFAGHFRSSYDAAWLSGSGICCCSKGKIKELVFYETM